MRESDLNEFQRVLDKTCSLLSRGSYEPEASHCAMFFRALVRHDLADVRRAFEAHIADPQRGRFVPTPADILAQLTGAAANDGRPGAEEAWAMALRGMDEAETIVWTAEMAEAWGIASPVLNGGDEVGARMAFRESYNRIVQEARDAARPASWSVTLGYDETRREPAIREAISRGRLAETEVGHLLPLPAPQSLPMLEGPRVDRERRRAEALEHLKSMGAQQPDPLEWAKSLKARDEAGEPLSEAQRNAWRSALEGSIAADSAGGGFRPIPAEFLPPAMRGAA